MGGRGYAYRKPPVPDRSPPRRSLISAEQRAAGDWPFARKSAERVRGHKYTGTKKSRNERGGYERQVQRAHIRLLFMALRLRPLCEKRQLSLDLRVIKS